MKNNLSNYQTQKKYLNLLVKLYLILAKKIKKEIKIGMGKAFN
jgi:hypothetical protein